MLVIATSIIIWYHDALSTGTDNAESVQIIIPASQAITFIEHITN